MTLQRTLFSAKQTPKLLTAGEYLVDRMGYVVDAPDAYVRDQKFTLRAPIEIDGNLPGALVGKPGGINATIQRCKAFDFQDVTDPYHNGDGFSNEPDNTGWKLLNCEAYDNSDGGFDLSASALVQNCIAGGNKHNFRFWCPMDVAGKITSISPVSLDAYAASHFWLGGGPATKGAGGGEMIIPQLIISSDNPAPLFMADTSHWSLKILGYKIAVPKGTPVMARGSERWLDIDWGPQGAPKL